MKEFIKKLNWFERIYPLVGIATVIVTFCISSEKNWLSLCSSIVGIIAFFCVAKGFFIAPFLSIAQSVLYAILSFLQAYYGEVILGIIYIITSIITIFTWLKNRNKEEKIFVQINKIKSIEYLLLIPAGVALFFGCFFMLKAFNTDQYLVGALSMVASLISSYLVIRRSTYYSVGYIINDVIVVVLWALTTSNMGLMYLPTILGYSVYFVNDVYALINWKRMEKKQDKQKQDEEQILQENAENNDAM